MKYVTNELVDYEYRWIVEQHDDYGDKIKLLTNHWLIAKIYCLWLNLRGK